VDKFISEIVQLNPEYCREPKWVQGFPALTDEEFIELKGLEPLKQELCSNIESFVPGYFDEFEPSSTVDDKVKSLDRRLRMAHNRWSECLGEEPLSETLINRSLLMTNTI
jgi:hypothetical protein